MPGKPRTPTAILKARGSWLAKLPDRQNEPSYAAASAECPECLQGEAMAHWEQVTPELFRCGVVTIPDVPALIALCQQWGIYSAAYATCETDGHWIETERGKQKHPAHAVMVDALKEYQRLAAGFGVIPAHRSKAPASKPQPDSSKARFFKAG